MDILYRRPLMLCCACFLAVSAISFCVNRAFKLTLMAVLGIAIALSVLLTVLLRRKRKAFVRVIVLMLALLFSLIAAAESFCYFEVHVKSCEKYIGESCRIVVEVEDERRSSSYDSEYLVRVESVNGERMSMKAILKLDIPAGLRVGSVIALWANCVELEELSYDGGYRLYCLADGINVGFSVENADDVKIDELAAPDNKRSFAELNESLSLRIEKGIDGEPGKLASAMLLGNRELLSHETDRDFARTGISHILSLSGLHMALLTGFFELILRLLRIPKLIRCCLMPIIMLGYLMLTGFQLPALRAAIMLSVVYVSFVAASPSDIMTVLFATCAAIMAAIPSSAADVGFWMSFFATMGIIIMSPYAAKTFKIKQRDGALKNMTKRSLRYFVSAIAVTLTAAFSTVLFSWMCFGETSLLSPIANLYATLLTTFMMVLSVLYLIFGGVPILGGLLALTVNSVGDVMLALTSGLSDYRGATVSLRYDFAAVIIIVFCISMAVLLTVKLKKKLFVLLPPAVAVISFAVCLCITNHANADSTSLSYIRRGEREILLVSQNGQTVMCDLTDGTYSNHAAAWNIAADRECATELEVLLLTHYHDKHRGSAERLFSSVKVRSLWMPTPPNEDEYLIARELMKIAGEHGVDCSLYTPGQPLRVFGDHEITVGVPQYIDRSSQPTMTIEISSPNQSAIYIGSSYLETASVPAGADTVIFGTHGPNPKLNYDLSFAESAENVVFADDELLSLAQGRARGRIIKNCEYIRLGKLVEPDN